MKPHLASACLLISGISLHADVTYVDATLANTDIATGGDDSLWADGDDGTTGGTVADGTVTTADQKWRFRSGFGNGGIWEASSSTGTDGVNLEDAVEIVTSATVPIGIYNVFVFYYAVNDSGDYPIRAGFSSGTHTVFDRAGNKGIAGLDAATLTFDVAPPTGGESRTLFYGLVGQTTVSDGTLNVYIDDFPASSSGTINDRTWYAGIGYAIAGPPPPPPPPVVPDQVAGTLISIDPDAGWTWYTDQRAIIDGNRLIAGGVRGKDWFGSVGDIVGTQFDLTTGQRSPFLLGPPPIKDPGNIGPGDTAEDKDDHNTAAFLKLPDGHYLSAWSSHSENNQIHFRRSTNPGDATSWEPEQIYERSVANGASGTNDVTYNDLIFLSGEGNGQGRIYNFFRNELADSWDRWFIYSDDLGITWNWGGRHTGQVDNPRIRPYPKYATNGVDTIWWVSSEDNSGQSVWSGYIKDGKNHQMDGTVVDADIFDNTAPAVGAYTAVMLSGTLDDGTPMSLLWPRDLEYDSAGNLAATWRGYGNGSNTDIRQYYGRWDAGGGTWNVHRLCFIGDFSVTVQQDGSTPHRGTPLSAINPRNANVCFFSANVDPATGAPLVSAADNRRNFEIFRAETSDGGATWSYRQITRDSSCHNFRLSVIPWDDNNTAVMWMRGYYDRWYFNADNNGWDTALVAWLDRGDEASDPFLSYTDADLSNTTLANGAPLTTHTTGTGPGGDDNEWHYRTEPAFGNNGTLFTANESAPYAEDCPVIKTTVSGVSPGTYDVFACFWSPRGDDYDIMAGLSETSLAYFERQSSQHAPASEFDTTVHATDGVRYLYRGYVGRVTLANTGAVEVFIDQLANADTTNARTWYDGVALQRVGRADTDSDGDGISDADEVIAGTDLFDPDSFFAVDSLGTPEGGPVEIGLSGRAGRTYQLWRSTNLVQWEPVGPLPDPLTTDGPVQLTDPVPPAGKAFYRASVKLP